MATQLPLKDKQTVTPDGEPVADRISGVVIRLATTHEDDRGELCELYNPAWGFHDAPMVYAYQAMVRPGKVKGWIVHRKQDDRLFIMLGSLRVVLFDDRPESPTYRMLNHFTFSERRRALISIPMGVFHAVQNVGVVDAYFVNLPTRAYDHADPDKYRLPLENDLISFNFSSAGG